MKIKIIVSVLSVAYLMSACSTINGIFEGDDTIDYKKTTRTKPLDIPPDLTQPKKNGSLTVPELAEGVNTYSAYHGLKDNDASALIDNKELPEQLGIAFKHEGANSWLVLKGSKQQLWTRVRDFMLKTGFILIVDNQNLGIMETEWAENRANVPKDGVRKFLGSIFDSIYDSNTRDKFRIRLEETVESNEVELFITHRGMTEKIVGDSGTSNEGSAWEARPSDPTLEAEMLKRLMVDLGVQKKHAVAVLAQKGQQQPAAHLVSDDKENTALILEKEFPRAWRLVGLALDRVSFTVVDRNRSEGIYFVRYSDPDRKSKDTGILSKLNFWSDDKPDEAILYQVKLVAKGQGVRVTVNNEQGQPERSSTAGRILKLLHEQLK